MNTSTQNDILHLKKTLHLIIKENNYNLLSPEILALSQELDLLLNPFFKKQL